MAKEAYYFSHDSNARNDDKIIALRMRHQAEGYGVYFMILERLRESSDYMSVKDYNMLAFDFRVGADKVKSVVEDFGLFSFTDDGKRFYSESFSNRMKQKDEKSEKARQSANKRWGDKPSQSDSNANASNNGCEGNALKEKKGKEIKEILSPPAYAYEEQFPPEVFEKSLPDCYNALFSDQIWWESVCMNNHITAEQFMSKLQEFFKKLQNEGEKMKSVKDGQSHFARWLAVDIQKQKPNKPQSSAMPKKGKIESVGDSVEEALRIMRNGQI